MRRTLDGAGGGGCIGRHGAAAFGRRALLRLFNKKLRWKTPLLCLSGCWAYSTFFCPPPGWRQRSGCWPWGVRATPMRLRISVQMPRDGRLWLFVPVFLGAGFLCSLLTTLFLQRLLAAFTGTARRRPSVCHKADLPRFLYFIGMCGYPPYWRRLLVRGAMQAVLSRWGTWFSIVVSSVVFTLLHGDIARRCRLCSSCRCSWGWRPTVPALWRWEWRCTLLIIQCRFLTNMRRRRWTACPPFAFAGYLVAVFCVGAVVCLAAIRRLGVMRRFRPIPRYTTPRTARAVWSAGVCAAVPAGDGVRALRAAWPLFAK